MYVQLSSQPINVYLCFVFCFSCMFKFASLTGPNRVKIQQHYYNNKFASLWVSFCRFNKSQNLISIRKMNFPWGQQSSAYHRMVRSENLPPICVASKYRDIATCLRELNNKIIVRELHFPTPVEGSKPIIPQSEIESVEVLICDVDILSSNYDKMPRLKWAHCTWAGVEPLFESIPSQPSFIVTRHAHEGMSIQIAEYVLCHVLLFERNFFNMRDAQKEKKWVIMEYHTYDKLVVSRNLNKITLGVLGVGNIGQAIAKCFRNHGTHLIGLSKSQREESQFGYFNKITVSLIEVLSQADYIVNTLPSTPETIGLLDGDVLRYCKKGTVFINVGRGDIVHEDTLLRALEYEWLHHLVLDVFQKEPLPANSKLWEKSDKITLTPHCAGESVGKNIAEDFMDSFSNFLKKEPMKCTVDWEKRY